MNTTAAVKSGPLHFDPLSAEIRRWPHPYYDQLNETPVLPLVDYPNFYIVSGYETVSTVLMDPHTYDGQPYPGYDVPIMSAMRPEPHARLRGAIQTLFTNRALEQLTPYITQVVKERTDDLLARNGGDVMELWANPIPLSVIAKMFGFADKDEDLVRLHTYGDAAIRLVIPLGGPGLPLPTGFKARWRQFIGLARAIPSVIRLLSSMPSKERKERMRLPNPLVDIPGYPRTGLAHHPHLARLMIDFQLEVLTIFKKHLANPGHEVVDFLIAPYQRGELSLREILSSAGQILVAGFETTANTLASAIYRLAQDPALLKSLKSDPALLEPFIDELLRVDAPLQRTLRRTTRPVNLAGVDLPENAQLILMLGAANMDKERFECPHTFDPARTNARRNLTFGRGIHMCIGAQLAKLETRIALTELLGRIESIRLMDNKPPERVVDKDIGMWGFSQLSAGFVVQRS